MWLRTFLLGTAVPALQEFIKTEVAGGAVLLVASTVAIVWASTADHSYIRLWSTHATLSAGSITVGANLRHCVDDGLMTLFFFVAGLEMRRELTFGELSNRKLALLPAVAALAGMAAPAAIYLLFNPSAERNGWGIPMPTDIAFTLGVLALVGSRAPFGLKAFVLALAIFDDIASIVVIALFYSSTLNTTFVAASCVVAIVCVSLSRLGITRPLVYVTLGVVLWVSLERGGVSPTLAGVFIAFAWPLSRSTADGLETNMHHVVTFAILPLFALANVGVAVSLSALSTAAGNSVFQGILAGRLAGKLAGITLATLIFARTGLLSTPSQSSWRHIVGAGIAASSGFTVSLLITDRSFESPASADAARLALVMASLTSALASYAWFRVLCPPNDRVANDGQRGMCDASPASPDARQIV